MIRDGAGEQPVLTNSENLQRRLLIGHDSEFSGSAWRSFLADWQLFDQSHVFTKLPKLLEMAVEPGHNYFFMPDRFNGKNPRELRAVLQSRSRRFALIFYLESPENVDWSDLIQADPQGICCADDPVIDIYQNFQHLLQGKSFLSDRAYLWHQQAVQSDKSPPRDSPLTPRQQEVLCLLAKGYSVKEIAQMLNLSAKSVDSHKYRIMKRLRLNDRVRLARYAIRMGYVEA